jgi:hypothetical protein
MIDLQMEPDEEAECAAVAEVSLLPVGGHQQDNQQRVPGADTAEKLRQTGMTVPFSLHDQMLPLCWYFHNQKIRC